MFGQDISDSCKIGASRDGKPLKGADEVLKLSGNCCLLGMRVCNVWNGVYWKTGAIWGKGGFDGLIVVVVFVQKGLDEGLLGEVDADLAGGGGGNSEGETKEVVDCTVESGVDFSAELGFEGGFDSAGYSLK